jgi:hypothetical protein
MNLWVKRTGQLLSLAVALFFLSCQDDVNFLGYRNPNDKFDVKFVEIPLESSVFLTDSVRTAVLSGELARILVGQNNDGSSPFGSIKAIGFSQVLPVNSFYSLKKDTVDTFRYDSVALELRFDYYVYGAPETSKQTFSVHELEQVLNPADARKFYSTTPLPYIETPIGSNSISVDPEDFEDQFELANASKDTTVLHISLDSLYGARIMSFALEQDTSFNSAKGFTKRISGLAIVPGNSNDKVLGIDANNSLDPGSLITRLVVYYHREGSNKARTLNLGFGGVEYTKIEAAQTGDLMGLMNNYDEVTPPTKRYIQQGTRIMTKVDFDKFYQFAAQDSVQGMIINSAELSITGIDNYDVYQPMPALSLVTMANHLDNRYHKARYRVQYDTAINGDTVNVRLVLADTLLPRLGTYKGYINDVGGLFSAMADGQQSAVTLVRDGPNYIGFMTMLAQHLAERGPIDRYRYFTLLPSPPSNPQKEKALNRISFDKQNLKLKIYYTIPKQQVAD